ncbi:MAG: homoserine kinase [Armatimonadetes bacterium]|nr:homoserine kinase [Armatimonadota bacterium]
MKPEAFEIRVPATTANLGPGFDSLGLALRLYNRVRVAPAQETVLDIEGQGRDELPRDQTNLMIRAAAELARQVRKELPPLHWQARHSIPLARGLGSSSAAIVGGLLAADAVLDLNLPRHRLVHLAAEIEGHPDNVAPALLGGLTICLPQSDPIAVLRLRPHRNLRIVLLIPDFHISTEAARRVLPSQVPFQDAVYNLSRAAAVAAALRDGQWHILAQATQDKLHQPYRLPLMDGIVAVMRAVQELGKCGVALSGSGPTVSAFCEGQTMAKEIAEVMKTAARRQGIIARILVRRPDGYGALVRPLGSPA